MQSWNEKFCQSTLNLFLDFLTEKIFNQKSMIIGIKTVFRSGASHTEKNLKTAPTPRIRPLSTKISHKYC